MKKVLLSTFALLLIAFAYRADAQAERKLGPAEQRMVDSVCVSVNKLDISKVTTREQAVAVYTSCIQDHLDLLADLAAERGVEMTDQAGMKRVGVDLALDLYKMKCEKFVKLSMLMAQQQVKKELDKADDSGEVSIGKFKRIDLKGFNYIVLTDKNGQEKSFLWLRQFDGSEKFMNSTAALVGKSLTVSWREIEVYLPQAKGYYKVKEIIGVSFN